MTVISFPRVRLAEVDRSAGPSGPEPYVTSLDSPRWPAVTFHGQSGRTALLECSGRGPPPSGSRSPQGVACGLGSSLCVHEQMRGRPPAGPRAVWPSGLRWRCAYHVCVRCISCIADMRIVHAEISRKCRLCMPRVHIIHVKGDAPRVLRHMRCTLCIFLPFMHPGVRTIWNWKTCRERSSSGRAPIR